MTMDGSFAQETVNLRLWQWTGKEDAAASFFLLLQVRVSCRSY
jgi:hypothetical protein